MEPTRRQLPREAKAKAAPTGNNPESWLFAKAATTASRKFLMGNPESGHKSRPRLKVWNAAIDHLYQYPGDIKTFEGAPDPKGKHAK
jgi:hypothetical protein